MSRQAQRLRKRLSAARRQLASVQPITLKQSAALYAAFLYVRECYEPNLKEPFSIANRRDELVAAVFDVYPELRSRVRRRAA